MISIIYAGNQSTCYGIFKLLTQKLKMRSIFSIYNLLKKTYLF